MLAPCSGEIDIRAHVSMTTTCPALPLPSPPLPLWHLGTLHSGEINIMEHVNVENVTVGTVHYGGTTSQNYVNCYQSSGERGCSDRVEGSWSHQALVAQKISTAYHGKTHLNTSMINVGQQRQYGYFASPQLRLISLPSHSLPSRHHRSPHRPW